MQHLELFERTSYLFYRRRRYRCDCGKRFSEDNRFVQRYQRHTIEWNQALGLRVIQGKNFKDTADQFRTSQATVIRRFDHISEYCGQIEPSVRRFEPLFAVNCAIKCGDQSHSY
ncbi:transposase [Rossellomorea aquimaris]|uniref:Transposase n=1 Tax=Rossellomorea aquimaris TaxID=189382 RepID=A0A5D4TRP5_9BACI|nr:transposase [Rossellomorea aquimaris]